MSEASKYGVQAAVLASGIHVGRLNKGRTLFTDKEDQTDMVLAAVGQYVQRHFGGGLLVDFPGLGFVMEVNVKPLPQPATNRDPHAQPDAAPSERGRDG